MVDKFRQLSTGPIWRGRGGDNNFTGVAAKLKHSIKTKQSWYVTDNPGTLRYSNDGTDTWNDATFPAGCTGCYDVVATRGGTYWGIFDDAGSVVMAHATAFTSWTIDYTGTGTQIGHNIAVSLTGSLIAATVTSSDHYQLLVSTDSGGTWNLKDFDPSLASGDAEPLVHITNDRVVVLIQGSPLSPITFHFVGWTDDSVDVSGPHYSNEADSVMTFDTPGSGSVKLFLFLHYMITNSGAGGDVTVTNPLFVDSDLTWNLEYTIQNDDDADAAPLTGHNLLLIYTATSTGGSTGHSVTVSADNDFGFEVSYMIIAAEGVSIIVQESDAVYPGDSIPDGGDFGKTNNLTVTFGSAGSGAVLAVIVSGTLHTETGKWIASSPWADVGGAPTIPLRAGSESSDNSAFQSSITWDVDDASLIYRPLAAVLELA